MKQPNFAAILSSGGSHRVLKTSSGPSTTMPSPKIKKWQAAGAPMVLGQIPFAAILKGEG